ncbi:MAG: sugar porter family MFS transporter [Saprospiraceae bacterium]|jgi:SP family arabinose:H+ symporter-like MFS transporter|nr:sugar porter family MFS transporter [Saprospiraceae bacterium]MBP6566649.1 sugar porter family MFS transporter [Saprospiraceae bacterium]
MSTNKSLFLWSIIAALAGFLFGFDTVVISGAEKALQELWPRGEVFHGWVIMSSALWGTVIGAIFGGIPTDKYGRKPTLIAIGLLYFISAIGSGLATDPWMFSIFRFIGGLGVGASTVAAPIFISEIAPAKDRGKLVALYQFNIVFGILIAFISNFLLKDFGTEPWRWMVGIEALPAFIYFILVFLIPESPRWLITVKDNIEKAIPTLKIIEPDIPVEDQIQKIKADHLNVVTSDTIWKPEYRFPVILAFLISFFNQFSGINAFLYYAPRIFEIAGLEKSGALLSSIGIGITNLVFTYIGLMLIDRLGRRQLMYVGSIGYIVSLSLISMAFFMNMKGMAVPIFYFIFIASHAIGQGTIIWVFISEIFPNHLRGQGTAFGTSIHWVLAAIIPAMVPWLFKVIGPGTVFAVFAVMMVGQLIFTWKVMPETKGVSLEDIEKKLSSQ